MKRPREASQQSCVGSGFFVFVHKKYLQDLVIKLHVHLLVVAYYKRCKNAPEFLKRKSSCIIITHELLIA